MHNVSSQIVVDGPGTILQRGLASKLAMLHVPESCLGGEVLWVAGARDILAVRLVFSNNLIWLADQNQHEIYLISLFEYLCTIRGKRRVETDCRQMFPCVFPVSHHFQHHDDPEVDAFSSGPPVLWDLGGKTIKLRHLWCHETPCEFDKQVIDSWFGNHKMDGL